MQDASAVCINTQVTCKNFYREKKYVKSISNSKSSALTGESILTDNKDKPRCIQHSF
ncbi:hypothetical protein PACTADRAFT_48963 [Pachysolen tannophilus NRRL Y-2460]|uniref:Uncharacterized protein n=1 Tax=Pachysolen tannophilus NRRL Y-2460 TaxID=669874 RepID=A0A1E4TZL3_PACTA|nr:hypothetical protein PACTADRAFT_48963 [Pachysolen tannophilus NRRL Y-2460]